VKTSWKWVAVPDAFTQVVLEHTQANLFALDYSSAVDANYRNNGPHDRLQLFQANMFHMPLPTIPLKKYSVSGSCSIPPISARPWEA
jgi:hypothetical protein